MVSIPYSYSFLRLLSPDSASSLRSPIGTDIAFVSSAIENKIKLMGMGSRLHHFAVYDAILLLRYSFYIPHLMFILCTAPSFLSSSQEL